MITKWAFREMIRGWRMSLFFVLNISVGLTGYISIEAFKDSLQNYLKNNAKQILSADLSVSARRELTDKEIQQTRQIIGSSGEETQVLEFFAMLGTPAGSRLITVKAVDPQYPFYGSLKLEQQGLITSNSDKKIFSGPEFWSYQDLKYQLDLKPGDEVSLGQLKIHLSDFIQEDSSQTLRAISFAPRIYINRALVPQTELVKFGSTRTQSLLYKLKDDSKAESLQKELQKALNDPAVQIETARSAGEDSGRQLGYLSDFLGLVALVSIFLSGLGITYIYQLFLSQRLEEIAIYRSLGLSSEQTLAVFILQAGILGLVAMIPSLIGAQLFIPFLTTLISKVTAFSLEPHITLSSILLGAFIAIFLSLLVCWPIIIQIKNLNPAQLFREEKDLFQLREVKWWLYLPSLFVFWILAIYQSNSLQNGSLFVAALVGVMLLLALIGWLGLIFLDKINSSQKWTLKYALKSLSRKTSTSLSIFVTLGVGTLLINLLPQLKTSLKEDLNFDQTSAVPSLFFFDIQDDQIGPLNSFLAEKKLHFKTVSPMIRARILKINDLDYERKAETSTLRTREDDNEARMRNRGVNLSYREELSDSESIVDGQPILSPYDPNKNQLPQLSVEYRFAERMGLKIHDKVLFDVQGLSILAEIVNVRRVKWTSFQPNFFILFQSGVLNDAPKTFIGILPALEESSKQNLMKDVVIKFGNVSMIDVSRMIKNVLQIADQMSWSLELMSALAFLTGYIVLFSIIRSQIRLRRWELNMLKILGADRASLHRYLLNEFVLLSFLSSFFGVTLSFLVSGLMMKFIFDSPIAFSWEWSVISILVVPSLAAVICFWASRGVIEEKPIILLREA